jgi:serine/threonine-protein kinase
MELLRGESLYERYRARGPLPWRRVIAIARAVCSSLAEAHALGIIHRDLKPTNIHLEPGANGEEHVKVLDFGIAKILQEGDIDSSDLTHAGQMIGTLDYMSPEQMVGGMCDAASDLYTLGVVMYEMIAGRRPFDDANSPAAALAAVLTTTPDRLATRAIVTPAVDRIVMRCLERQHDDRFQSATELAAAIDEILPETDEVVTHLARPPRTSEVPIATPTVPTGRAAVDPTPGPAPGPTPGLGRAFDTPAIDPDATLIGLPPPRTPTRTATPPAGSPQLAQKASTPSVPTQRRSPPKVAKAGAPPLAKTSTPQLAAGPPLAKPSTPSLGTPAVPVSGPHVATLQSSAPPAPTRNLREAYPTIHRPPPSATRPPTPSPFDDRPSSSVGSIGRYETPHALRSAAAPPRLLLVISVAVAIIAAILIAAWL